MPALGVGQTTQRCVSRSNLPPGQHMLSFIVDEARAIGEMNEHNNVYEHRIPALQSTAAGPQPLVGPAVANPSAPAPTAAQADLAVKAVRVRGEEAGGPSDCDPGKNDVTVIVKNEGTGASGSFVVRVHMDDDDDEVEEVVAALDPGKELELRFDDVRLKKGERKLTATADAKKAIAESDEDNNELRATVRCQDEGD
jgi:subtilase family serine protease